MNQEQNNLNTNNFDTQDNNGISNNQTLSNNQNLNNIFVEYQQQNVNNDISQQLYNVQNTNNQQPVNCQNTQTFLQQADMQSITNKVNKKTGLIIGLIIGLILLAVTIFIVLIVINKDSKEDIKIDTPIVEKDYKSIGELETGINLEYNENGAFLMWISDVYTLLGVGTVVEGTILRGTIELGDQIQILGISEDLKQTTIKRVEISRKEIQTAKINDYVSLILDDYHRDEISMGQVVVAQNSMIASTKFNAELNILESLTNNNSYDICFNNFCQKGKTMFDSSIETISLGENVTSTIYMETLQPVEIGFEFEIRENEHIIATGKISEIFN